MSQPEGYNTCIHISKKYGAAIAFARNIVAQTMLQAYVDMTGKPGKLKDSAVGWFLGEDSDTITFDQACCLWGADPDYIKIAIFERAERHEGRAGYRARKPRGRKD